MASAKSILIILALVCFLVAALGVSYPRVNFIAAGLFLWLLEIAIT